MKYYTHVFRSGSRLYVREIKDGKRRQFKTEYRPTLYVPCNEASDFHSPDGVAVKPLQPGTMHDCYEFMQKYKDVDNFRIYGNTAYEYAFLNEEYPGPLAYKLTDMVLCNLDIEVEKTAEGYSEAKDAANRIIAITMKVSVDNVFHVFACQPFDEQYYNRQHMDTVIAYHQCEDEADLLEEFLQLWELVQPDIITGWNCRMYDCVYLINRITRIMSDEAVKRLSPWSSVRETTANIYGEAQVVYDIAGVSILDYLIIYRKNVLEPRESYRLDYIAQVELGEGKVDYGEYADLQELYEKNFDKFIEYNIHDVRLVDRIDAKRKLIELQLIVAYHAKVNFVDVLSQVRTWDTHIHNHLLAKKIVVPQKTHMAKEAQFYGAFVMQPVPGMYEWIVAEDVQSLYPRTMQMLNIGIESKLKDNELTSEMRQYQKYIKDNMMTTDDIGGVHVSVDNIMDGLTDELMAHFKEHDVAVGTNGVFYRRDPQSFYSEMIGELFENRLDYKNKAKEAGTMVRAIKNELEQRKGSGI